MATTVNNNALSLISKKEPSLRFCEFINTSKTIMKWGLYGASGYMCYYLGINVVYDFIASTIVYL